MKRLLPFFILIFLPLYLSGQSTTRTEVKGVILSANNDVEAVTIFNMSSNKGTITNEKGNLLLK